MFTNNSICCDFVGYLKLIFKFLCCIESESPQLHTYRSADNPSNNNVCVLAQYQRLMSAKIMKLKSPVCDGK